MNLNSSRDLALLPLHFVTWAAIVCMKKLNSERLTVRLGFNVIYFSIFRHAFTFPPSCSVTSSRFRIRLLCTCFSKHISAVHSLLLFGAVDIRLFL